MRLLRKTPMPTKPIAIVMISMVAIFGMAALIVQESASVVLSRAT